MRKRNGGFAAGMSSRLRLDGFLQALRERSMSPRFAWSASLLVFAMAVLLSETLLRFREAELVSQREAATMGFASSARAGRPRAQLRALSLKRHCRLPCRQARPPGCRRSPPHSRRRSYLWTSRAQLHDWRGLPHHLCFPARGQRAGARCDYRDIPAQWPTIKKTIDSGENVLTGPVSLLQGDRR